MQAIKNRIFAFNQTYRDMWMQRIAAAVPAGSRVLDVGAGTCPYRPLFSHCRYETQDFAKLDDKQHKNPAGYGKIDYVSDIVAIPVPDATFDAVICTEVLEHVPDPVAAVREMARVLKVGGRIIVSAPLGSGLHQQPYHFYGGFTPFWYERFLRQAGFEEIAIEPNGGFFLWYGQESQRFNSLLQPSRFRGAAKIAAGAAWILTFPLMRLLIPLICTLLDPADHEREFTVGYHVTATRRG